MATDPTAVFSSAFLGHIYGLDLSLGMLSVANGRIVTDGGLITSLHFYNQSTHQDTHQLPGTMGKLNTPICSESANEPPPQASARTTK